MKYTKESLFFDLIRLSLEVQRSISKPFSIRDWYKLYEEYEKQAITGVIIHGLNKLSKEQRPPKELLLQWIGKSEVIKQRNQIMDKAVIFLCQGLDSLKCRYLVVKGQTLSALYDEKGLRQSGDIDFYVHPDDWENAYKLCFELYHIESVDTHSEKHVEWESDGVVYEMHRMLNDFARKKHQRYWDDIIIKEAWQNPWYVTINDYDVSTLAPTYNAIYVFVHLFFHLISEGIGLRHFIDWGVVLEKGKDDIDQELLWRHLEGIGLLKAYTGLSVILTDYLGFPVGMFPFEINEKERKGAEKLMENILQSGNFGHNIRFVQAHGVLHGIQQMWRRLGQIIKFGHYAPVESWGMITKTFSWWGKKLKVMIWKNK